MRSVLMFKRINVICNLLNLNLRLSLYATSQGYQLFTETLKAVNNMVNSSHRVHIRVLACGGKRNLKD